MVTKTVCKKNQDKLFEKISLNLNFLDEDKKKPNLRSTPKRDPLLILC